MFQNFYNDPNQTSKKVLIINLLQNFSSAGCADDEKASALGRVLLQQDEEGLKGQVGVSRADGTVVEESFDVVDDDARHHRAVSVVEDLADGRALGRLSEANLDK
jgi:hypothetical protein